MNLLFNLFVYFLILLGAIRLLVYTLRFYRAVQLTAQQHKLGTLEPLAKIEYVEKLTYKRLSKLRRLRTFAAFFHLKRVAEITNTQINEANEALGTIPALKAELLERQNPTIQPEEIPAVPVPEPPKLTLVPDLPNKPKVSPRSKKAKSTPISLKPGQKVH